mmetsp:Transcript_5930/g.16105  ORF Transcript_5930/g.16105 Transcript_5930/m.16105 type:complete len:221 (-) Transcript_5930:810-1472(-)|eukprot:CAMPEP_0198123314 /NCGR_PEP_ID=MMETSP1442-20131203/37224_1 /TAXON_ID= /ORGANISM="Craspedostauros australis, Strain CCMP3328" /LENGTH=220 /DNA_ID=CAMNT_0043782507 /DNA_START=54 /DNA_END=716 /DNA_ORIENTATION=-
MRNLSAVISALLAIGGQDKSAPAASSAFMPTTATMAKHDVTIQTLAQCPADDILSPFVQLINDVYDVAEDGMWKIKGVRTNPDEIKSLIQEGRLLVATMEGSPAIVGCAKLEHVAEENGKSKIGEFGMLVVDPNQRGHGIGGKLIAASEQWALQQGYTEMQLELLTPRDWEQPSKEFNKKWYARLGYVPLRTEPFEKDYAHLTEYLATDCDFTVWRKKLE